MKKLEEMIWGDPAMDRFLHRVVVILQFTLCCQSLVNPWLTPRSYLYVVSPNISNMLACKQGMGKKQANQ